MEDYLITTEKFSCSIRVSESIIIDAEKSLLWAIGKKDEILRKWLFKIDPSFQMIRQARLGEEECQ